MKRCTLDGWEGDNLHVTDEDGKHLVFNKCQFVSMEEPNQPPLTDGRIEFYLTFNLPFAEE
jgi:hypothetical protein